MGAEFALTWPRPLFDWEVESVLHLLHEEVGDAVILLLREAACCPIAW